MKRIVASLAVAIVVTGAALAVTPVTFDKRENVNLLNNPNVVITAERTAGTVPAQYLLGMCDYDPGYWQNSLTGPGAGISTWIKIDLGATRNVKTVRTFSHFTLNNLSAQIEYSDDGVNWVPTTVTSAVSGKNTSVVLDQAVDTRYLRVTGDTFTSTTNRWVLDALRVYGDSGASLAAGTDLDLVSLSAYGTANALTVTTTNASVRGSITRMLDDRPPSIDSDAVYNGKTGSTVTFNFDRDILFGKFGFQAVGSGTSTTYLDPNMTFAIKGSTDGVNFTETLLTQTGGVVVGPNFFDISAANFTGTAVRFEILSTTKTNLRFSDFFVYQGIAEQTAKSKLGLSIPDATALSCGARIQPATAAPYGSSIVLTNAGEDGSTLTLTSATLGGANPELFEISGFTDGSTLAAGASQSVNVSFLGSTPGVYTATLAFLTDAQEGSQTATYTLYAKVIQPGDANDDNKVDFSDYLVLEAGFGGPAGPLGSNADFNNDSVVDFADYLVLEANFGTGTAVPEPMTLGLLCLGGLALLRRR